jgi:Tfp pilus tip-associated adhesin PilY1
LSQERRKEEMSNMHSDNNNKIIFKYFIAPCVSTDNGTGAVPLVLLNWKVKNFQNGFINAREESPCKLLWNKKKSDKNRKNLQICAQTVLFIGCFTTV